MSRKAWSFVLVGLLVLAPALAGCLEGGGPLASLFGGGDELTALEARSTGDDHATSWHGDARLILVGTVESHDAGNASWSSGPNLSGAVDPDVGNGEAPAWWFTYGSEEARETLSFVVWANGNITHEETGAVDEDDAESYVGPWTVDSDEALEAARGNATFADAEERAGEDRWYVHGVVNTYDKPEPEDRNESDDDPDHDDEGFGTVVTVMVRGNDTAVMAFVNATSGEVVFVMDFADAFEGWGGWGGDYGGSWGGAEETTYASCHSGTLSTSNTEDTFGFPVSRNASEARIQLQATKTLPTDTFTFVLATEAGEEVASRTFDSGERSVDEEWTYEVGGDGLAPGRYDVSLTYGDGSVAMVDYDLDIWVGNPGWDVDWDWDGWMGGDDGC